MLKLAVVALVVLGLALVMTMTGRGRRRRHSTRQNCSEDRASVSEDAFRPHGSRRRNAGDDECAGLKVRNDCNAHI